MFAPYTPIDKCIGKEIAVRFGGESFAGMLAGVYNMGGIPVMVLTPMHGGGTEQHIPLTGAVVTIRQDR